MRRMLIFAYVVAVGIETGAALFTSVAVFPVWAASPEVVTGWKPSMPYFVEEGRFFMFASTATMLLAVTVVIASVRLPVDVRRWALSSAAIFLLLSVVTMVYFLPAQGKMHGDAGAALPRPELATMLDQFVTLNWIRQALLLVVFVLAVHSLGLSYRGTPMPFGSPRSSTGAP